MTSLFPSQIFGILAFVRSECFSIQMLKLASHKIDFIVLFFPFAVCVDLNRFNGFCFRDLQS